ncbi:DUF1593 domain-containing protein [Sphingomonas melonis]|uniref:Uncharacterized protein n=1 Tax=Sphingomonas melonis TaxID=152682 RepID=A0A7Y9FKW2_9SPHN|nr:DUF1593 domain-containing protein [Sphingomonas melonis]NYD89145.1 hypothetical protein [Sphingomonas melonis]
MDIRPKIETSCRPRIWRVLVSGCIWSLAGLAIVLSPVGAAARRQAVTREAAHAERTRLIVLSDIGNEPDDQMSMVRLMLYTNEIDVEGLVAVTSTWLRTTVNPQTIRSIIDAYATVRPNLLRNADGWPTADSLSASVVAGQSGFGMAAVGEGRTSPGAKLIIDAADRPDSRPLWISVWGGANTLAQALETVRATRTAAELDSFIGKLRVYSISDQDDAGPWIRREFPGLFYVVSPSRPDNGNYASATWTGISGDRFYKNGEGAEEKYVTNEWLDAHIRKGPLGAHYPRFAFIMEGDTPAFLGLTDNGLASMRDPSWGGWGGRYVRRQPYGEDRAIWTQGGDPFGRVTSSDTVTGVDGRIHTSDQATVWRWRAAFQNDFAARILWTMQPPEQANHHPVVAIDGSKGTAPLMIDARVGEPVTLDASGSRDPDLRQRLTYRWYHYAEAGFSPGRSMAAVRIDGVNRSSATVTPTAACRPQWIPTALKCSSGVAHLILAVTDTGRPALTSYRRVILNVRSASGTGPSRSR